MLSVGRDIHVFIGVDRSLVFGRLGEIAREVDSLVGFLFVEILRGGERHVVRSAQTALLRAVDELHGIDRDARSGIDEVDTHGQTAHRHDAAVRYHPVFGDDAPGFRRKHHERMPCLFAVFPADLLRYEQRREVVLRNAGIGVSVGQGQQRRGKRFVGIGHEPNIVGSVLFHVERSGLRIRIVGGVERFVIVAVVGEGYGQQAVDFLFFVGSGQRRGGVVVACGAGRSAQREDHAVAVRRLRAAVRSVLAASGQQRRGSEECGYEACFHCVISFFCFLLFGQLRDYSDTFTRRSGNLLPGTLWPTCASLR